MDSFSHHFFHSDCQTFIRSPNAHPEILRTRIAKASPRVQAVALHKGLTSQLRCPPPATVSGAAYLLRAEEVPEPDDEYEERLLLREDEVEREDEELLWPRERLAGERPCTKSQTHVQNTDFNDYIVASTQQRR